MLPTHIQENEFYTFVIDQRHGHYVVLTSQEMLSREGPVEPLWHREAADERSFDALLRWVMVRRGRWQEWGQLAEALGPTAFYQHMRERMAVEPLEECTGSVLQREDDPREIVLGEMMHDPRGLHIEELYRHRFASPKARERFFDWFYTDRNCDSTADLLLIALNEGTAQLGRRLDEIATEFRKRHRRAEPRAGAKARARTKA